MIFCPYEIKKHGIIIDMIKDAIAFCFSYYILTRASSFLIFDQTILSTKIMPIIILYNITFSKIIRKSS